MGVGSSRDPVISRSGPPSNLRRGFPSEPVSGTNAARMSGASGSINRPSAAIVGGGVSGLTAAYVLSGSHDVTLFEADERWGGHTHTHRVGFADGVERAVDSGFIVFNERTYPMLCRLFDELGIASQQSEMSLSISCDGCGLEYSGGQGPRGLFA